MRYIKEFANATALQAAVDNGELGRPYLCYLQDQSKIAWDSEQPGPHDYSKDYLTFEIISGNGLELRSNVTEDSFYPVTVQYKVNSGNWTTITIETSFTSFYINNLTSGDTIQFKGNRNYYGRDNNRGFKICGKDTTTYNVYGNIMSMIYGDDFVGQTVLTNKFAFANFLNSTNDYYVEFGLKSAENLILPATTLTEGCYQYLFNKLKYLTTAPELPATTLVKNCYQYMFVGCSNLNYIKCLATSGINNNGSTTSWVNGVSATGTFVKKSGVNWPSGLSGIPSGWTVIEE